MFLKMKSFQDFGFFFAQNWSPIFVKLVLDELVIGNNKPTQGGFTLSKKLGMARTRMKLCLRMQKTKITKLTI